MTMWFLPISILIGTTILAVPLSKYLAWIMNGKYRAPGFLRWFENRLKSGDQNWKQYVASMLIFNTVLFVFRVAVPALPQQMPLNDLNRGALAPSTIFHSVISFMTNTDLQHYSGDQHFSNFSQIFFGLSNFFLSASIGFCGLTVIIRAFRSDAHLGNFFVDMWRVVIYMFLPCALILAVIFVWQGSPMTFKGANIVSTLEPGAMASATSGAQAQQTIVVGPVAALVPIKMLGTNGGGFYGMNAAHPMENPTALANWFTTFAMMIFPFTLVL